KQITLAAWISKSSADTRFRVIFDKKYDNGFSLTIGGVSPRVDRRGKVTWSVNTEPLSSDGEVTDGKWHHVAATFDGTEQKLYLDGKLQREVVHRSGPVGENEDFLSIGGRPDGGCFAGLIDEAMMYNRALTSGEVERLYEWAGGAKAAPEPNDINPAPNSLRLLNVSLSRTSPPFEVENETEFLTTDPLVWCLAKYSGGQESDKFRVEWRNPTGTTEQQEIGASDPN